MGAWPGNLDCALARAGKNRVHPRSRTNRCTVSSDIPIFAIKKNSRLRLIGKRYWPKKLQIMPNEIVKSFVRSLAHREGVEAGASLAERGGTTAITYAEAHEWPWPRRFNYATEFFCTDGGDTSIREVLAMAASHRNHVVNLFADQPERESPFDQPFLDIGYTQAWVSPLLSRALVHVWSRPTPEGVRIHEVLDARDMARYASVLGISNPGTARDSGIHNFFALVETEVVAKGQLITLPGEAAYISDVFCVPEHRRRGLCHAMMRALEDKARALGARQACLAPGPEVMSYGLYAKYGYRQVASRSVLMSAQQRGEGS